MVNFYYNLNGSVSVIKVGQMDFIIVGQRALYFPDKDQINFLGYALQNIILRKHYVHTA